MIFHICTPQCAKIVFFSLLAGGRQLTPGMWKFIIRFAEQNKKRLIRGSMGAPSFPQPPNAAAAGQISCRLHQKVRIKLEN